MVVSCSISGLNQTVSNPGMIDTTDLSLVVETVPTRGHCLVEERIIRTAGRTCLTTSFRVRWRVWVRVEVERIQTVLTSLTETVERVRSSGDAGRRGRTRRQSRRWTLLEPWGPRRQTIR